MEMLSSETWRVAHFTEWIVEGAKRGEFFSFSKITFTRISAFVWVSSFASFECFILGNIFQSQSNHIDAI